MSGRYSSHLVSVCLSVTVQHLCHSHYGTSIKH